MLRFFLLSLAWGSAQGVHLRLRETKSHRQIAKWRGYTELFKEWADLVVEDAKEKEIKPKVQQFMDKHNDGKLYYIIPNDAKAREIEENVNRIKATVDAKVPRFCGRKPEGYDCKGKGSIECQAGMLCSNDPYFKGLAGTTCMKCPPEAELCHQCINGDPNNVKNEGHENSLALFLDNAAQSVQSLAGKILRMLDSDCAITNEAYLTKKFASSTAKLAEKLVEKGWHPIKIEPSSQSSKPKKVLKSALTSDLKTGITIYIGRYREHLVQLTKKKLTKEQQGQLMSQEKFKEHAEKHPETVRIDEEELAEYTTARSKFFDRDFKDGLRCSIVCKTLEKLSEVIHKINNAEKTLVPKGQQTYWKNSFKKANWEKSAYADVKAFVPMKSPDEKTTTIAEIQFHFVPLYDASPDNFEIKNGPLCPKEQSHLMYKELEGPEEKVQVTRAQRIIFLFGWCLVEDLGTEDTCCPTSKNKKQDCWKTILIAREVFKDEDVASLMKAANNGKDVSVKKHSTAKGDHKATLVSHG